jgi:hypothetical protein
MGSTFVIAKGDERQAKDFNSQRLVVNDVLCTSDGIPEINVHDRRSS